MSEFIAGIHNQNNIRGSGLDYRHINTSNCFLTTEQLLKPIFSCLHTNIKCHLTFCRVSETSAWAQRYDIRRTESFEFLEEQLEAVRGPLIVLLCHVQAMKLSPEYLFQMMQISVLTTYPLITVTSQNLILHVDACMKTAAYMCVCVHVCVR